MSNLFGEMKRRNVFRVAGMYAVVGWVLAQIATTLEETMSLPVWFDGLIVALLLIGFPIAIVFAWAFELTPQGVVRTEDVPESESITGDTGHKLDYAIVAGLVLLAAMIVWQQSDKSIELVEEVPVVVVDEPAVAEIDAASIAVLPFADLSPGGDQEYFSDGISEEILNVLVGVNGLDVTSRTSSFQFKGRDLGIPEIAAELKVRHVLEGSVRKSGETIRVTAQLIDSMNDKHLWSDTFDRPLTTENIFEIQDEIAKAIVAALSETLGVGELEPIEVAATTRNLDAYELYLQARPMFHARESLDVADALLERAVMQDPEFAEAWEIRAALQTLTVEYGFLDTPIEVAEERGAEFAKHALDLEPRSATALAVIARMEREKTMDLRSRGDFVQILADFESALEIQPRNASALNWRGLAYLQVGDLPAALRDFSSCIEYEPFYRPCVENHYTVLGAMAKDGEAIAAYLEALNTSSAKVEFAYLPSLVRRGEELAFKMATNDYFLLRGWRHHDELWQAYNSPGQDHSGLIESIRLYLDEQEGGYAEDFQYITNPIGMGWRIPDVLVVWDPMMHAYRQSAEFKSFIRDSGVFDYWQQAGFPPQCRPVGDDDFECD
jgi:TolB-like protein